MAQTVTQLFGSSTPLRYEEDPHLLEGVLQPYKEHCRYLQSATVSVKNGLGTARGEFSIPSPCYIDDTGHFNAVEFNICYNQLVYYLLAKSIKENAVPALGDWSVDDYWVRQLPDILIARFRSIFRSQIDSTSFSGEVAFRSIDHSNVRQPMVLTDTTCRFWDKNGGRADGEVLLALLNPPSTQTGEVAAA